jgi:hypothetical protein
LDLKHQTIFASTSGLDESLQGLSTDPFGSVSAGFGLRIPPVVAGVAQNKQPRFLFLLASRTLGNARTCIRGIRQGLTIGINQSSVGNQELAYEMLVSDPWWRFVDGNVSWHLVAEPTDGVLVNRPDQSAKNTSSLAYWQADTPALIFQDISYSAGNANSKGVPNYYNVGISSYTPPDGHMLADRWTPIANLGNMKGIYYPWNATSDDKLNIVVSGNRRISLYASVLQTNPVTRLKPNTFTATNLISSGISNEDAFVANFTSGELGQTSPIYWRIFGSILFDDAFGAD